MKNAEQRKFQRIWLKPIEEAFATIENFPKKPRFPILNISYRGLAIGLVEAEQQQFMDQKKFNLTVELDGVIAHVKAVLAYLAEDYAGISFITLDEVSRRIISAYLDPRYLGTNLKEIPSEQLQKPDQRIFIGNNATKILVRLKSTKKSSIIGLMAIFQDHFLEVNAQGDLRTGVVKGPFLWNENLVISSHEVEFHPKPQVEIVHALRRLLAYTTIPEEIRLAIEIKLQST
jgi:hypothetical protein